MLKEFRSFVLKDIVLYVAVAVVLALAFTGVVGAITSGILTPIIAAIFGQPNFDSINIAIGQSTIELGFVITSLLNFLFLALAMVLVVRAASRLKTPAEPGPTEIELLTEIRDSLANRTT